MPRFDLHVLASHAEAYRIPEGLYSLLERCRAEEPPPSWPGLEAEQHGNQGHEDYEDDTDQDETEAAAGNRGASLHQIITVGA